MNINLIENQRYILEVLGSIQRHGINKLIEALIKSDYFEAPASTAHHLSQPGGLAQHSLHVLFLMVEKYRRFKPLLDGKEDSIKIIALLHDMCKVGFYERIPDNVAGATEAQINFLKNLCKQQGVQLEPLWIKTGKNCSKMLDYFLGNISEKPVLQEVGYKIKKITDTLEHGTRSLFLLSKYIDLTDEEAVSIRWHMGETDLADSPYSGHAFKDSMAMYPLLGFLMTADQEASICELHGLELKYNLELP